MDDSQKPASPAPLQLVPPRVRRTVRIPIGVEKLLTLAAADSEFRRELVRDRAAAVERSGYVVQSTELAVLASVSDAQLEAMISRIDVKRHSKRDFMRSVANVALAAAASGALLTACKGEPPTSESPKPTESIEVTPDYPPPAAVPAEYIDLYEPPPPPGGARPDLEIEAMPPPNAGAPAYYPPVQNSTADVVSDAVASDSAELAAPPAIIGGATVQDTVDDGKATVEVDEPRPTRGISPH